MVQNQEEFEIEIIDDPFLAGMDVEQQPQPVRPLEEKNLAKGMSDAELLEIAGRVIDSYEEDNSSRSEWVSMHAGYKKLYDQTDIALQEPWSDSSQESFPLLTEGCNLFAARASKAFFPGRNFVGAIPVGGDTSVATSERVERVSKHMNYQLNYRLKNYKRDKKATFLASALHGSDFTKTYYDPILQQAIVERVRASDLIVPFGNGPRDIEDIERKTQIIRLPYYKACSYYYKDFFIEKPVPVEFGGEGVNEIQEAENLSSGLDPSANIDTEVCILEQHAYADIEKTNDFKPYIIWVDSTSKKVLRIERRYEEDSNGEKPVEVFTHYPFLINPDGFYGNGLGHLIGKLNIAANKILREAIDAGELANVGNMSGFINDRLNVRGGELELLMGKFQKITSSSDDIRKDLFQFQFPGPNSAYVQLGSLIQEAAQRLSSTTQAATGDVDKVIQPLSLLNMLEQSLQLPSSIMEDMAYSMELELAKLHRINKSHPNLIDFYTEGDTTVELELGDYADDLKIYPIIDPKNITRQQKMARAQVAYEFGLQNPVISQNPQSVYILTKAVLEGMELENIDEVLPPPEPPVAPEPERIDDQHEEIRLFLLPEEERPYFDVFPDQNHKLHLAIIDDFLNSPENELYRQSMDEIQVALLMDHRQKHISYLYIEEQRLLDGEREDYEMALLAGDEMGAAEIGGPIPGGEGMEGLSPLGEGFPSAGPVGGAGSYEAGGEPSGLLSETLAMPISNVRKP